MISTAGSDGWGRAAGFSLVELLAVAAIMGVLAGVAAVSLRGLRTPALSSAANEVASAVKMTRQMAIASGRNMYLVIPVASNELTSNLYRTYAIFEEVQPGQEMTTPDSSGNYSVNPTNDPANSWFIPRTDWRILPDGVVFYGMSLRDNPSVASNETNFGPIGQPEDRSTSFQSLYMNMSVRKASSPTNVLASFASVPYLRVTPAGRFSITTTNWTSGVYGMVLRLAQGNVRGAEIVVTDTNNYFSIEADAQIGRVRVRGPESYSP